MSNLTLQDIKQRLKLLEETKQPILQEYREKPSGIANFLPAAVLIPFLQIDDGWHLLFIRRTHHEQDRHSGQVAFPGGRADPGDGNPIATALREAHEEIGLDPDDVTILGRLNLMPTVTHYRVTPIIGVIPWPYPFQPDPREVRRIFTIPLSWLADTTNHETRMWQPRRNSVKPHAVIFYQPYDGEILWGASARMVQELIRSLNLNASEE
jgi:8-oxo-dGTP pyrophosphatase MutT (NUDIX family)